MLYLILGPSGVGKGTQIELLKKRHPEFEFPKSVTTRKMRPGESQGNPYHFIALRDFEQHVKNKDFLEWAKVHKSAKYGTLRSPIEEALQKDKTVIKELDIQGLMNIKKTISKENFELFYDNVCSIFIMPPSEETLIRRILKRSAIKEEELNNRLRSAKNEMKKAKICDHVIETTEEDSIEDVYKKLIGVIAKDC